jgi:DNA replication protein DnaC
MKADALPILFRSLELSAMERECESAITRAEAENWGYARLLHYLAEAEVQDCRARKIARLLKYSGLPPTETFARFDETRIPEKPRRMLSTLLSGDFVRRGDNLVAIGLPGRGKTGYCAGLGRELIERHQMKVLFIPAFKLAARLLAAKRDLKLVAAIAKLNTFDAVIVDELGGYVDLNQGEVDVLFSFFGDRYEKKRSVFVTTNLAFSEWDKVFKNPMTATAIVDRLIHRCVLLEFPGKKSIREEDAKQRQAAVA